MYQNLIKPILDFIIAVVLLSLTLPITLLTGILLLIANRGSVFFVQERPGKNERIFKIIKFKTMNDRRDAKGNLLPDEVRLTRVGRLVRRTSIDELPQLINVLKGDMSIVGPRPLLCEYLPLYNQLQRRRHEVKPGITGWAQVNGRNNLSWEERFKLDVWYVDNQSFTVDLKIIWFTVYKTIKGVDVNQTGHSTVEYFKGNNGG